MSEQSDERSDERAERVPGLISHLPGVCGSDLGLVEPPVEDVEEEDDLLLDRVLGDREKIAREGEDRGAKVHVRERLFCKVRAGREGN